jgi:hypothetical protein
MSRRILTGQPRRLPMFILAAVLLPATAWPQAPSRPRPVVDPGRPGSFEVAVGPMFSASSSLGDHDATLTSNGGSSPFNWFSASSSLDSSLGAEAHIVYNVTRRLALEGGVRFSRPVVRFSITGDSEQAPGFTSAGEHLSQYVIDGSLLFYLPSKPGTRGRVFLSAGAGYLRQLHEDTVAVETGRTYHVGAGVKYFFGRGRSGFLKGIGLRGGARLTLGDGGFSLDSGTKRWFSLAAGLVLGF